MTRSADENRAHVDLICPQLRERFDVARDVPAIAYGLS